MITDEDISTEFSLQDNNDKDHRRVALLNDANYGIVLCFLDKFRLVLDLPNYSLQRLEDHLINCQERIAPRLIDFHFILLKRLSLAKNTQRDKFDTIITKFASRFDLNDGDHLTATGYLQAEITVKIRILKNLLESQFDLNQTFKNTLIDKSAREIKSTALGRDRFGVSYWLFTDTDCFVRLFREDVNADRTWSNVAKDRDELENFIKALITDSVVRKKFIDWTIDYEPFLSLLPSNEFEERYLPPIADVKNEDDEMEQILNEEESVKKKRGRPKSSVKLTNNEQEQVKMEIKHDADEGEEANPVSTDNESVNEPVTKKRGRPRVSAVSLKKALKQIDVEIKQEEIEPTTEEPRKKKRGRPKSPMKSLSEEKNRMAIEELEAEVISNHSKISAMKKVGHTKSLTKQIDVKIKVEAVQPTPPEDEKPDVSTKKRLGRPRSSTKSLINETKKEEEEISSTRRGRKRKIMMDETSSDDHVKIEDNDKQNEESAVDSTNLSIRRSSRPRKAPSLDPTFTIVSETNSQMPSAKKKRSINSKTKTSNDPLTTNKPGRSRRRRRGRKTTSRRHLNDEFCLSSSSSDEHLDYLSEYDSDDYLPDPSQVEHDENFFELDEDNNPTGEEFRTAKTAQASTIITSCNVCSKSDRPEVLLLCDDCDDAYHLECLRPKLLSVPDGDWFCPLCEQKKLSNYLIDKLKELLINFNLLETKRLEHDLKKSLQRKLKTKEYSSDESVTASESEHENLANDLRGEESMLSISQTNENSNISSSYCDDSNKNISQRGRHRRSRFDMNKMLNDEDDDDENNAADDDDKDESGKNYSSTDEDDEYVENKIHTTNFDVQIPKKMTRLLNQRYQPITRNDQYIRPKPIAPRLYNSSVGWNNKLGAPSIYVNGVGNCHQIKSVAANSNQTLKIVRRWNDVQRRNNQRTNNLKSIHETTSDCADEHSVFCPDDSSPPRSNDSNSNHDIQDDDSNIIRSKITLTQSTDLEPIYRSSTKNIVRKNDVNFDRLTRDIQYAVSEANTLSTIPKTMDQQQIKRIQKTNFSPYVTNVTQRPLPVLLPKPVGLGYKIFKSKDPPTSTSTTTDLSSLMLTPSSSSSILDTNDEQSTTTTPINA